MSAQEEICISDRVTDNIESGDDALRQTNGEDIGTLGVTEGENVSEDAVEIRPPAGDSAAPTQTDPTDQPQAVDDFLRNFLKENGMTKTLDCFEREWYGQLQRGLISADPTDGAQDVSIKNQRLESELKKVQRVNEDCRAAAVAAADAIVTIQKERHFHRLQHKCVVEEKNALAEETRKLKVQCARFEPAIKEITDRYQTSLRQKMLVSLERDRLLEETGSLQATLHNVGLREDRGPGPGGSDGSLRKGSPKEQAGTSQLSKHPRDSEFPQGACAAHRRAHLKVASVAEDVPTKADRFHLRRTITAHAQPISGLSCHPTMPVLASASEDRLWKLWGLPEGDTVAPGEGEGEEGHTDWVSGVSFHPDGTKLGTTGGDGSLRIWDLALGRRVLALEGHGGATWGCSFHSCGDFVASCSMDRTVKVWDLHSERCRSTLRGHAGWVNSVEFRPSSNTLLASSADRTLSLWDARTATRVQAVAGHGGSCNHAAFSPPPGHAIASCDSRGVVMLWDVRNLAAPTVVMETGPKPSNQVAFNPGGRVLAVAGGDGLVRALDVATGKVACMPGHNDAVQSVVFDHKGEYLLSGASDGKICVWSA